VLTSVSTLFAFSTKPNETEKRRTATVIVTRLVVLEGLRTMTSIETTKKSPLTKAARTVPVSRQMTIFEESVLRSRIHPFELFFLFRTCYAFEQVDTKPAANKIDVGAGVGEDKIVRIKWPAWRVSQGI
jgi:hypothetical protein